MPTKSHRQWIDWVQKIERDRDRKREKCVSVDKEKESGRVRDRQSV